ncbi:hypothetical protein [Pararhizobium mangrovi]|uniref:Uncharacterized protein n=1 Tax=Pararhizobium mangrovi TaxID=2590452 RepID=A0A506TZ54_9HYPH|nr:hypothetical protein [Pararhizobium mangrovi]TPW26005.1 hypothetical protein FJU11_16445 [Pararhizobium mangrovi]
MTESLMTSAPPEPGALSLYFDLRDGEKADLEVVAAAAIKWVETLRAAAREIDPEATVKIDLLNAEEGSLRLNTILEWLEIHAARIEDGYGQYPRLRKLAIAAAVFVPISGVPTYDFYFGDHVVNLSQEDRERLDELTEQTANKPSVATPRRDFFNLLEKDPSIKGVGASESPNIKPTIIIPSNEFAERGGLWDLQDDAVNEGQKRTIEETVDVTLISPVLLRTPRTWKFQPANGMPEFTAKMADERFLEAIDREHVEVRLKTGIEMRLRLSVVLERDPSFVNRSRIPSAAVF